MSIACMSRKTTSKSPTTEALLLDVQNLKGALSEMDLTTLLWAARCTVFIQNNKR